MRIIHWKSENIEFMTFDKTYDNNDELFESLLWRHKIGLETSMRRINFFLGSFQLLYGKFQKINFKCGQSYEECPEWMKNKEATINPRKICF